MGITMEMYVADQEEFVSLQQRLIAEVIDEEEEEHCVPVVSRRKRPAKPWDKTHRMQSRSIPPKCIHISHPS